MDRDFHRLDCVKFFGSPLRIKRWNTHKIKVSNVKGILAWSRMSWVGRATCRGILIRGGSSLQSDSHLLSECTQLL